MIWGQGVHFEMHPTQVEKPPRSYFQSFQRQRNSKHVSSQAILWIVLVETSKCNLFFFRRLIHLTIQLCMTLLSLRTYETDYTHLRFGRYWNPHEAIQMNHNNACIFWHRSVKSMQLINHTGQLCGK
jgi:hypothetical protein